MSPKKYSFFFLLILAIFTLSACGGASFEDTQSMGSEPAMMDMAEVAIEREAMAEEGIAFANEMGSADSDGSAVNQAADQERLIIRTANLSLIVTAPEDSLQTIARMAEQNGGWVVSSNIYQYNADAKSGDITIRVPAAGFNSALETLKEMAIEVEHENIAGQDVTEEFVDLEARLDNLETTAARVRTFLDEAETVEEALAVNQELSRLEGEIERLKGRMQYLSQSAAFSTISIFLTPDIAAQPPQVEAWRPEGVVKEAVEALVNTLQGLGSFAIWLMVYILPVALLIGVPLYLVFRIARRRWQGRQPEAEVTPSTD